VLVTGRGLPQPIALICLSEHGLQTARATLESELTHALATLNTTAAPHERIARLVVIREAFSLDNGMLTPTLKVRRHSVEARYSASFDTWASQSSLIVWGELRGEKDHWEGGEAGSPARQNKLPLL
jgi:hypothetical protein